MSPNADMCTYVYEGHVEGVRSSITAGANVNNMGRELGYLSPLLVAARLGYVQVMNVLVEAGADLEMAAKSQQSMELGLILPVGIRPLHAAVLGFSLDAVKLLLKLGANCNSRDARGRPPLFVAIVCATKDSAGVAIVRELLDAGADPAAVSTNGMTALHAAVDEIVYEAENGATVPLDVIKMILSKTPSSTLNTGDDHGETPLGIAARGGCESVVRLLLSAGASDGENKIHALAAAVQRGHETCFHLLIGQGIDSVGLTMFRRALRLAAEFKRVKMLQVMLALEGEDNRKYARLAMESRDFLFYSLLRGATRPTGEVAFQATLATVHVLLAAEGTKHARKMELVQPCGGVKGMW